MYVPAITSILRDKGVNVELGIPYDLWDTPSAGVAEMHRKVIHKNPELISIDIFLDIYLWPF